MCLCVYVCVLNMHCIGCCMQSVCVIQVSIYDCICCCKRTAKNVFSFSLSVRREDIICSAFDYTILNNNNLFYIFIVYKTRFIVNNNQQGIHLQVKGLPVFLSKCM